MSAYTISHIYLINNVYHSSSLIITSYQRTWTHVHVRCYAVVRPSVVCLFSVCNVRARGALLRRLKFSTIFTPFGTLAICWLPGKILRRSSQGNPSVGGVKGKRGSQTAILDLSKAISRKRCKIGGKLLLVINRKSYIIFRLVPKSVTLNDVERC